MSLTAAEVVPLNVVDFCPFDKKSLPVDLSYENILLSYEIFVA